MSIGSYKQKHLLSRRMGFLNEVTVFSVPAKQAAPQHRSNKFVSALGLHCFLLLKMLTSVGWMVR